MNRFDFHIPVNIVYGRGEIGRLGQLIPETARNVLIVTDSGLNKSTKIIKQVEALCSPRKVLVYDDIEENPGLQSIERGGMLAREFKPGLVLGVGGGSAMDAAKGIANQGENSFPIACVPTTSGTGSEVTPFAVFTDTENKTKLGFSDKNFFPSFSVIDPELTYSMPRPVIMNTGLDSLAHAIEAYLSKDSFDLSDALALRSVNLVIEHLPKAVQRKHPAMDAMAYSAMLSGMAITHASTILPHIMGYPLTVYHGVPHGRAGIILLPALLDYLAERNDCQDKLGVLDKLFHGWGGLRAFLDGLNVSTKLSDYGVKEHELETYVQKTIVKGDVAITPGNIDEGTIMELYRRSM